MKAQARNLVTDEEYQLLIQQLETIHLKLNIYIKHIGIVKK
ncbi:MAG: Four helix bundle protein [Mucilaginibacter sp.]|nr:Four helix bundle protein [Mucilaginibacter sp.]